MALENAAILEELKERYKTLTSQLNELSNTRIKIEGAIDVLQQIEDSEGDVGESSSVDGKSSKGTDSSNSDS